MSIVENCKFIWKFIALIWIFISFSSNLFANPSLWEEKLDQRLLLKWQSITEQHHSDAKTSIENLPKGYVLPKCKHEFKIDYIKPLKPGRNAIRLSCKQPFWQQHASVRLHWFKEVAHFAKPVRSKQALKLEDIRMVKQDVGKLNHGYFDNPKKLVGMVSRRQFSIGMQITPSMLDPKTVIKRGETVVIRLKKPQIKIEIQGKAMSDGHLNQKIRVRNSRSKKIIYARVIESGVVQID